MSLQAFFDAMHPFLTGRDGVDQLESALGSLPGDEADHRFYPWLVAFDQRRILAELYPAVKALVDRTDGLSWDTLVAAFVAAHPPRGHSVPHLGDGFADWLAARREAHPEQPEALECLADLRWVRFLAHTAPDVDGVGVDVRLFMRHYPLDVVALERLLLRDPGGALPEGGGPRTLLIVRHATTLGVLQRVPSLATLAVLARAQGMALAGPLAELSHDVLAAEEAALRDAGVLP